MFPTPNLCMIQLPALHDSNVQQRIISTPNFTSFQSQFYILQLATMHLSPPLRSVTLRQLFSTPLVSMYCNIFRVHLPQTLLTGGGCFMPLQLCPGKSCICFAPWTYRPRFAPWSRTPPCYSAPSSPCRLPLLPLPPAARACAR